MDINRFKDMSGDKPFCDNCPDRDGCSQGVPCWLAVLVDFEAKERTGRT